MTVATETEETIVLCQCAYTRVLPSKIKHQVKQALDESGKPYREVEDLCRMAANEPEALAELGEKPNLKIAACYPRAVKWLFHAGGTPLPETSQVLNMREQSAQDVAQGLLGNEAPEVAEPENFTPAAPKVAEDWKPWFPVIDFDRCTNCMQCLSFCLFDVYGVTKDEKKIQVANPTRCKTDCPACSRVCPEAAIMFPKYKAGPINGAEVSDDDLRREKMQVDISSLLGGDIYQILRDRNERARSRFSKERDDERALKERKRCLKKLQDALDIPEEVMNALPSPDLIRKKAEKAAEQGV